MSNGFRVYGWLLVGLGMLLVVIPVDVLAIVVTTPGDRILGVVSAAVGFIGGIAAVAVGRWLLRS